MERQRSLALTKIGNRAITGLSGSLLIETTAKGGETEDQFRRLAQEGCTHFQGYLIGRPGAAVNRKTQLGERAAA